MSEHFWVSLVAPSGGERITNYYGSAITPDVGEERKIHGRYPKIAAETFIMEYFNESMRYKPNVFVVQVREPGSNKIWKFGITTTVVAKKIK